MTIRTQIALGLGTVGALLVGLAGCSSSGEPAAPDAATPDAEGGQPAGESCTAGTSQTCWCPDGTKSGMQMCQENGAWTPCDCPDSGTSFPSTDAGGGDGGNGEPALCPELEGKTGCTTQSFESEQLPASILFVVDRSSSMNCNPPPVQSTASCNMEAVPANSQMPSKWDITTDALKQVFDQLGGQDVQAGLTFFSNNDMCGVNSQPRVDLNPMTNAQVQSLETVLDSTQPNGGTPVIGATILGYQHLHEEAGAGIDCPGDACPCSNPPCGAPGNRFLVLLTDGEESCVDEGNRMQEIDRLLDMEAPKAVDANVRTFVIGAPGSGPARGFLSALAAKGGTGSQGCTHQRHSDQGDCHFDMTQTQDFASDLTAALNQIRGSAVGCEFPTPETLDEENTDQVNVQYTPGGSGSPMCIPRAPDQPCDGGANGWKFARTPDGEIDRSKIELCGQACEQVQGDSDARVDILVGCESVVVR